MKRLNFSSGTTWESVVGYSRAVRTGPHVYVAGTTATDASEVITAPGDPYRQTVQTIQNIERALEQADSTRNDVVRIRIFTTNIENWKEIARAHEEFFGDIRPATTMVEISRLISPEMLVEIEAEAYVEDSNR